MKSMESAALIFMLLSTFVFIITLSALVVALMVGSTWMTTIIFINIYTVANVIGWSYIYDNETTRRIMRANGL